MNNIELFGDRIVVQLDCATTHTISEGGLEIPLYEEKLTDGARLAPVVSPKKYLSQGTVLAISNDAKNKIPDLNVGDQVFITAHGASATYQFFTDRSNLVITWDGKVCIPHSLIEARIS